VRRRSRHKFAFLAPRPLSARAATAAAVVMVAAACGRLRCRVCRGCPGGGSEARAVRTSPLYAPRYECRRSAPRRLNSLPAVYNPR
jgi:hypothetical protein